MCRIALGTWFVQFLNNSLWIYPFLHTILLNHHISLQYLGWLENNSYYNLKMMSYIMVKLLSLGVFFDKIKYLHMQHCKFGIFQPHTLSSSLCHHQHIDSNRNARHPRLLRNLYHVVALVVHPRRNYQSDANCMNLVTNIGIGLR